MKYSSEEIMEELRSSLEEQVLRWPQVSPKKMFGCPYYQAHEKLFTFLVTNGVVITQLILADRETLSRQHSTTCFQAGKKTVQNWVQVSMKHQRDLDRLMPFVRKSYESARAGQPKESGRKGKEDWLPSIPIQNST